MTQEPTATSSTRWCMAEQYGADALRFTLATGGAPGNDFRLFDEKLESRPQLREQDLERLALRHLEHR